MRRKRRLRQVSVEHVQIEGSRKISFDFDEDIRHYEPMATQTPRPTDAELAILNVLWEAGPKSVRDVQHLLNQAKPTGYTTVLKMLQIMTDKGLVDRDESVRPQIYRARYSRSNTQRRLLTDLLHRAFDGSVRELVLQALATRKSSPQELEAIEELLDRLEGESK
jgi:BlaI family penicillinase repressor